MDPERLSVKAAPLGQLGKRVECCNAKGQAFDRIEPQDHDGLGDIGNLA